MLYKAPLLFLNFNSSTYYMQLCFLWCS